MRAIRCVVAAILAAGLITVVAAQPGAGGFGGGINVNTAVLDNKALQEELKITDAQKEKFKGLTEKRAEVAKLRPEFGKGKFDKDANAKFTEANTKLNEDIKKLLDDTLTADQKKRLKQIEIQVMSLRVFNDPEAKGGGGGKGGGGFTTEAQKATMKEVQSALKLSEKQLTSIREVTSAYNKERQDINKEAGIGGGFGGKGKQPDAEKVKAANEKIEKVRKDSQAKIEELLDDTQKKTWKELVGAAFDTTKLNTPPAKKD